MTYKEACQHTAESYGTIYLITNTVTGKQYVGQTIQKLALRLSAHKWHSTLDEPAMTIHRSIKKHGFEKFTFDVLGCYENQQKLDAAELNFARQFNTFVPNGYNLLAGSGVGAASDELKEKLRIAATGVFPGDATRVKLSEARTDWHANRTPEVEAVRRQKISEARAESYVFRNPAGERVEVTNLKQWCEDNGFTRTQWCKLALIAVGKKRSVKGWSLWTEPDQQPSGNFRKLEHVLRSPTGERVVVKQVKAFCDANGMAGEDANLRKVTRGQNKTYKGWSLWVEPGLEDTTGFRKIGYRLRSPEGEQIFVPVLKDFCVAKGFTTAQWGTMRKVVTGTRKGFQGWTLWVDGPGG